MKTLVSVVLGASLSIVSFNLTPPSQAVNAPHSAIDQATGEPMTHLIDPLVNTEWRLEDLAGAGVIDDAQATLRFNDAASISGRGTCNRYRAGIQSEGDRLSVSAIAATRMMCPPALMDQETRFFAALQLSERIELDGDRLLLFSAENDAPLRFSRLGAPLPNPSVNGQTPSAGSTNGIQTLVFLEGRENVVRVFVQDGETRMNIYSKLDRATWMRGVEVDTRQTREGTVYTNHYGELEIAVIVPNSGESPQLVINGEVDR